MPAGRKSRGCEGESKAEGTTWCRESQSALAHLSAGSHCGRIRGLAAPEERGRRESQMCCKVAVRRLAMCSRSMAKVTALLGKCLDKFAKNPVAGQACNRADCPSRLKEKATLAKGGPDKPCSSEHVATVTRQSLTRLLSAVSIDFAVAPLTFLAVLGLESCFAKVPERSDQGLRGGLRHERAQTLVLGEAVTMCTARRLSHVGRQGP